MPGLPSPAPPRLPAGARLAIDEWRAFADGRYRTYQGIGIGSAAVLALAGDGLTIPLLLALGAPAALATVIGVLPFTFSAAQLLVPSLLRRTDGNLRGVTLAILVVGETRGFLLATIVLLHVAGFLPAGVAIACVATVMCLGGAASAIGGANLQAWYGAILPEPERRFVAPRVMGITQGLGAALLLPVALAVQGGLSTVGLAIYAAVFLAAGLAGLAELGAVLRLRRPGRVRVARHGDRPALSPETRGFVRIVTLAAAGAGFGPYLSIYAISVLGQTAGYAILLSAVSSAASLVAATIVGGLLSRGSASRTLRLSFVLRGGGILLGLLAFPGNPYAWLVLLVVAAIVSGGASTGDPCLQRAPPAADRRRRPHRRPEPVRRRDRDRPDGRPAELGRGAGGAAGRLPDVCVPDARVGPGAPRARDEDRGVRHLVDGNGRVRRGRAAPGGEARGRRGGHDAAHGGRSPAGEATGRERRRPGLDHAEQARQDFRRSRSPAPGSRPTSPRPGPSRGAGVDGQDDLAMAATDW